MIERQPMKKVHLNEHRGDDKNGGLSKDEPVLTWKRANLISRRQGTQQFKITGTKTYNDRLNAEASEIDSSSGSS